MYEIAVIRSLVYKPQKIVSQVCSLDNTFLYKISYTASLLQILHVLIPLNILYHTWNTQFIIYMSAHHISSSSQQLQFHAQVAF